MSMTETIDICVVSVSANEFVYLNTSAIHLIISSGYAKSKAIFFLSLILFSFFCSFLLLLISSELENNYAQDRVRQKRTTNSNLVV
jgi:hypothetical protein